jgi:hypothetical protein
VAYHEATTHPKQNPTSIAATVFARQNLRLLPLSRTATYGDEHFPFHLQPSKQGKKKVARERKRYDNSVDKNIMNPNWT